MNETINEMKLPIVPIYLLILIYFPKSVLILYLDLDYTRKASSHRWHLAHTNQDFAAVITLITGSPIPQINIWGAAPAAAAPLLLHRTRSKAISKQRARRPLQAGKFVRISRKKRRPWASLSDFAGAGPGKNRFACFNACANIRRFAWTEIADHCHRYPFRCRELPLQVRDDIAN